MCLVGLAPATLALRSVEGSGTEGAVVGIGSWGSGCGLLREVRVFAVIAVTCLGAGACGQDAGRDDVQAAAGSDVAECAQPMMIDGPTPMSIEELFTLSDVVAEVSVLRLYDEVGSQMEDERLVKHMLDVRVEVPYKGTAEGDTLAVYAAMEMSNPQRPGQGSALVGEANLVPAGSTALMNLSEGAEGEFETTGLHGGVLLIDGDDVSMPGSPTCKVGRSEPPENQLRDAIENTTISDLRQVLTDLAQS